MKKLNLRNFLDNICSDILCYTLDFLDAPHDIYKILYYNKHHLYITTGSDAQIHKTTDETQLILYGLFYNKMLNNFERFIDDYDIVKTMLNSTSMLSGSAILQSFYGTKYKHTTISQEYLLNELPYIFDVCELLTDRRLNCCRGRFNDFSKIQNESTIASDIDIFRLADPALFDRAPITRTYITCSHIQSHLYKYDIFESENNPTTLILHDLSVDTIDDTITFTVPIKYKIDEIYIKNNIMDFAKCTNKLVTQTNDYLCVQIQSKNLASCAIPCIYRRYILYSYHNIHTNSRVLLSDATVDTQLHLDLTNHLLISSSYDNIDIICRSQSDSIFHPQSKRMSSLRFVDKSVYFHKLPNNKFKSIGYDRTIYSRKSKPNSVFRNIITNKYVIKARDQKDTTNHTTDLTNYTSDIINIIDINSNAFRSVSEHINTFDISVCKQSFDGSKLKLKNIGNLINKSFSLDISTVESSSFRYMNTMNRLLKYHNRGFTLIDDSTIPKLRAHCNVNLNKIPQHSEFELFKRYRLIHSNDSTITVACRRYFGKLQF